ncbi:MAG: FHA domain-containing protein [Gammaproteobacteria bacterium]|nr:FHA domain-containing protein [Gammaproteobacteria bacterium]
MAARIKCRVFRGDEFVEEHEFDEDLVKIGKLRSSHLCLDGIARMHAVLERERDGVWRVIDLGSSLGTKLDDAYVDKGTELPVTGRLAFGDWTVQYEIEDPCASQPTRGSYWEPKHHERMMLGLLEEIGKLSAKTAEAFSFTKESWGTLSRENKVETLRLLVKTLHEGRRGADDFERRQIASTLQLGSDRILAVYGLTPEEALDGAHETIVSVTAANNALSFLREVKMENLMASAGAQTGNAESAEQTKAGYAALVERLETTVAGGMTLLLVELNRAGGHEISGEERRQILAVFKAVEVEANKVVPLTRPR